MGLFNVFKDGMKTLREARTSSIHDTTVIVQDGEPKEIRLESFVSGGSILKSETGWVDIRDSAYTEASPLSVNNSRVKITIDGLGANTRTLYAPSTGSLWDTVNNVMLNPKVGMNFVLRMDFKAKAATNNSYFDLQMDIGDQSPIVITQKTLQMVKGANVAQRFTETIGGYALDTFLANGASFYLDSTDDASNISAYDFGIFIAAVRVP